MLKKKQPKSNVYFDAFPRLAHFAVLCGEKILSFMENFDHEGLKELKESVHLIEHDADDLKHSITEKLLKEFMTPIDREDIFELMRLIDNVTDAMEEVSLKLYLYDYKALPPHTVELTRPTLECIKATEECLAAFPNFLDYETISPKITAVVRLEEECDTLYIEEMHDLYVRETDGFARHKAEAMYTMLEEVSDACRDVCRYVQTIAYKNL